MPEDLRARVLAAVREVRIKLGPNALEMAQCGGTIHLTPEEAGGLTDAVMAVLTEESALDCSVCRVVELSRASRAFVEPGAYTRLVDEARFGHDAIAHRLYVGLIRRGITTAEQVAALTDDQVYDLRNSGRRSLERVRSRFPRPAHDTAGGEGE